VTSLGWDNVVSTATGWMSRGPTQPSCLSLNTGGNYGPRDSFSNILRKQGNSFKVYKRYSTWHEVNYANNRRIIIVI